jgi:hypothetical protein
MGVSANGLNAASVAVLTAVLTPEPILDRNTARHC